jgi:hypothetical protein
VRGPVLSVGEKGEALLRRLVLWDRRGEEDEGSWGRDEQRRKRWTGSSSLRSQDRTVGRPMRQGGRERGWDAASQASRPALRTGAWRCVMAMLEHGSWVQEGVWRGSVRGESLTGGPWGRRVEKYPLTAGLT